MKKELQFNEDLKEIISILNEEDVNTILTLKDELVDNWHKKQIFRTETEMRVSVLNDAKFPTIASKYWQAVRELSAHFDALISLCFELRRNTIDKLRIDKKISELLKDEDNNNFDIMEAHIDLDQNIYNRTCMLQVAKDRVREITLWSKIKSELDDGTFDTKNVNTHQADSLYKYFENRVKALNDSSGPGEVMNAIGPYLSLNKLKTDEGLLLKFSSDLYKDNKDKLN